MSNSTDKARIQLSSLSKNTYEIKKKIKSLFDFKILALKFFVS